MDTNRNYKDMDRETISREAAIIFKDIYNCGLTEPRLAAEMLCGMEEEGKLTSGEYDAIVLADWRKLASTPNRHFRTRQQIAELEEKEDELDCVICELTGIRKRGPPKHPFTP